MPQPYRHQLHARHHRRHPRRWILLALVLIGILVFWLHSLKPQTQVVATKAITKTIAVQNLTKHWVEPDFSIDLPSGWIQSNAPAGAQYRWQGGQKGVDDSRTLDVYVDKTPSTLAVNRVIPVDANGRGLNVDGSVSANCSTFTGSGTHTPGEAPGPGLWNNLPFVCDLANYGRDVVGTISNQGVNTVILNGPSGTHHFFFVYTDSSYMADYDIFTAALQSFQAN